MERIITWFVNNPVAANLLMLVLMFGGLAGLAVTHQEEFPNNAPEIIIVSVPYLGAAPEEVESGVCIRVEEAVEGLEGIDKVESEAREGLCRVQVFALDSVDPARLMNEVKSKVDGISTLPLETEKPIVSKAVQRSGVLSLALSGRADEATLKDLGQSIRDDIAALPGVSQVDLNFVRPYEISIEISEHALRRWGMSFAQVADAVRRTSLDLPGGTIRTDGGEILLRTTGQAYRAQEFEGVVVLTRTDGSTVLLRDVAKIIDGFEEGDLAARFDGQASVMIRVYRIGNEDVPSMAATVKDYVATRAGTLPEGVTLQLWSDESRSLRVRLTVLLTNALQALALVVLTLSLFMRFRLAMWVSLGIPVAILGALAFFPFFNLSISSLSLIAFVLVIGVLVDDATVVGERVFALTRQGYDPRSAAIKGTSEVAVPVIFGVLTTVAAFLPMLLIPGNLGRFFGVVPITAMLCLLFSMIESQLILPTHLAHARHSTDAPATNSFTKGWRQFQDFFVNGLERLAADWYRPLLAKMIEWRFVVVAAAVSLLILSFALIASNRIIFEFFPSIEGDRVYAGLEMPEGTAVDQTIAAAQKIEAAAMRLKEELEANRAADAPALIRHMFVSVGDYIPRGGPPRPNSGGQSHLAEIALDVLSTNERGNLSTRDMALRWRELTGDIPDAVKLTFDADSFTTGAPIAFRLRGRDVEELRLAAAEVRAELARYAGVFSVTDSFRAGKQEIKLQLKSEARNFGLTLADLGQQVRQGFYGDEVQRVQRGSDDVKVMVRYPETERRSLGNLEDMRIRTPDGRELPFSAVAELEIGNGYSSIKRIDGERVVDVTADVDRTVVAPDQVIADLQATILPAIIAQHPGVRYSLGGEQEERAKSMRGLLLASLLVLFLIYALLAIPLKSYAQPLVIMAVIPFGFIGAIIGHWMFDRSLVFFSALGILALTGVVVNSSLVLVDYINRQRLLGEPLMTAVLNSGVVRFRPIVLTSATTFIGLLPMMFNRDPTIFPLVPMSISLGFGVLFATMITLIMIPSLYLMQENFLDLWARWWGRSRVSVHEPQLAPPTQQTPSIAGD